MNTLLLSYGIPEKGVYSITLNDKDIIFSPSLSFDTSKLNDEFWNKNKTISMIPFNKPFIIGDELKYIQEAVQSGKISGDGIFTKKCQEYFEKKKYNFPKVPMTTSCTDALEMAAILCDIKPEMK